MCHGVVYYLPTGRVVSRCPAEHVDAAKDMMGKLRLMVTGVPGATIPKHIQVAALQALLNLAPFDPSLVAEVMDHWLNQDAKETPAHGKRRRIQNSASAQEELSKQIQDFLSVYGPALANTKFKDQLAK